MILEGGECLVSVTPSRRAESGYPANSCQYQWLKSKNALKSTRKHNVKALNFIVDVDFYRKVNKCVNITETNKKK